MSTVLDQKFQASIDLHDSQAKEATMTAIEKVEPQATPMGVLQMAVAKGADIDTLTKLLELQERFEANQARKAFNAAMAKFKANPPQIRKNKHVEFGTTKYDHATLDHVTDQITAALSAVGISHKWAVEQQEKDIAVSCILTHELGHSERTTLRAGADTSGSKNGIQAIGSAVTYLQRYTLLAATGMAAGMDDDGGGSAGNKNAPMDAGEFDRYCGLIENAQGFPILQTTYIAACNDAGTDEAAKKKFKELAGKRHKELKNESR